MSAFKLLTDAMVNNPTNPTSRNGIQQNVSFVMSYTGFLDKMVNGIIIAFIQYLHPSSETDFNEALFYYRDVYTFMNSSIAILLLITVATSFCIPFRDPTPEIETHQSP
ncbi:hypothetical protein RF11_14009 [Thelohanellus kitauei]|uniref:Uncharacterized protein n=1 Tax=Thelohanellus kitauei TaxID=669202 RepID=A0A0C2J0L9_THEKT|nr:hypothetical protein RF11_14009 [Thelohanellus kitauei]